MSEVIRDKDGKIIQRSRNLRGIREYVGQHLIKRLSIDELPHQEGKLCILFDDGASFETNFASFVCLTISLRQWRNCYGANLWIDGKDRGQVYFDNFWLTEIASRTN